MRKGFTLLEILVVLSILPVVFLGLMGVVLLVPADGNQTLLLQADRVYLSVVESNLVASGAWTVAHARTCALSVRRRASVSCCRCGVYTPYGRHAAGAAEVIGKFSSQPLAIPVQSV